MTEYPIQATCLGRVFCPRIRQRARARELSPITKGKKMIDKCRFCGLRGLVLSTINADYSCEHCGEWQEAILNDVYLIVGYETEEVSE